MKTVSLTSNRTFLFSLMCFAACMLLPCFNLISQSFYQVETHLTTEQGLSSDMITDVYKDSRGLLWVGTENGLNCYDGKTVTVYNTQKGSSIQISNNFINDIAEDSLGHLWVATNKGLNIVNLNKKTNEILINIDGEASGAEYSARFSSILAGKDGVMWACTDNSICRINKDYRIRPIASSPLQRPGHLVEDKNGKLWGTLYEDLHYFQLDPTTDRIKKFNYNLNKEAKPVLGKGLPTEEFVFSNDKCNNIIGFTESSKQLFYLDADDGSLYAFDETSSFISIGKKLLHLLEPYINNKYIDSYNPWCKSILVENQNKIWVGTIKGLFLLNNKNLSKVQKIFPFERISLRAICPISEEKVYVGSYNGLYSWNPVTNKLNNLDERLFICDFCSYDDNNLLMTSDPNKLYIIKKQTDEISPYRYIREESLQPVKIFSVLKDRQGSVWAGSFQIHKRENQADSLSYIRDCRGNPFFKNETVWVIEESKFGGLWFGTDSGLYKKDSCSIVYHSLLSDEDSEYDQIAVSDIVEENDSLLLVATHHKGVYIYNFLRRTFIRRNEFDGLSDNRTCNVISEENGYWVSTYNGLNYLSSEHKVIDAYTTKTGTANDEFNRFSSAKLLNGDILFGGVSGCTQIKKDVTSGLIRDSGFLIGYRKINPKTNLFDEFDLDSQNQSITLEAGESYIEFFVKRNNSIGIDKVSFFYSLLGFDKQWIPESNNSTIRYTNLDAGQYVMNFKLINGLGTEEVFSTNLIVKQYFYESNWFKAILITGFAALLYSINYYRSYQKKTAHQFKEKLVNDLHDDIGGSLNNIQTIVNFLQKNNIPLGNAKTELKQIAELSNRTIGNMSDVIWSVNPDFSSVKDLIVKIKDLSYEMFHIPRIPFELNISNLSEDSSIDVQTRYQLLMICKEGFTNILKHTNSNKVTLNIKNEKGAFYLILKNSYELKIKDARSSSIGTKSLRRRAKYLNADIQFIDEPKQFTLFLQMTKI